MPDYKAMFLDLYHAVTKATDLLMDAQAAVEDIYIETAPYDAELDEHSGAHDSKTPTADGAKRQM